MKGTCRKLTAWLVLTAGLSALLAGCLCSEPETDEDRLKKRIDTSSVHIYLALKVAPRKLPVEHRMFRTHWAG